MTNKETIEVKIKSLGYSMGCYDNDINKLNESEVKNILNNLDQDYTDIKVTLNKSVYIIELATVDNEKDLNMLSLIEYNDRYGEFEE